MKRIEDMYIDERIELAKKGLPKDLDILVNDKNEDVRKEVAKHKRPQDIKILQERFDSGDLYSEDDYDYVDYIELKDIVNQYYNNLKDLGR